MSKILLLCTITLIWFGCGEDPYKHDPPKSYRTSFLDRCYEGEEAYTCIYRDQNCIRTLHWVEGEWEEVDWICYY